MIQSGNRCNRSDGLIKIKERCAKARSCSTMTNAQTLKNAGPAPRYTSYPTAPHFHDGIDGARYAEWLATLPAGARLSLYVHIPFCDTLCWFCGCHTKETRRYDPVAAYLVPLKKEIDLIAGNLPEKVAVDQIHWGGGSPTILNPDDIVGLASTIREAFPVAANAEFAIEIDPRNLDADRIAALAEAGMTRASLGVQDFNEDVQNAINRRQSFEETAAVIDGLRAHGVRSLNIDFLYGLPHQTRAGIKATVDKVIALNPDRIALFGYAHVPWMKRHQKMIDESTLPDAIERFAQSNDAANRLVEAGYCRVGMDHFARPEDDLATAARTGRLNRNFQGYTADSYDALIGLGASAIGELPQGYVQNIVDTRGYCRAIESGEMATCRGIAVSTEDQVRRFVIERLMCDFALRRADLVSRFGEGAQPVIKEADHLADTNPDGFFRHDGDGFVITDSGRPYVRTICASFDTYFATGSARHSAAV